MEEEGVGGRDEEERAGDEGEGVIRRRKGEGPEGEKEVG